MTVCRVTTGASVAVGMSSPFKRNLKFGSGRSRRSAAMTSADASSGSSGALSGRPASTASTARSNCSMRFCSGMHLRAQVLHRSPLQLFDRSLALCELLRDFANAATFDKTHHDDALLLVRKPSHALGK